MKKEKRSFLKILMGLMLLFFYLPIGFMIVFSFNSSKSLTHFTGFSMQWYTKMLSDASMMESLYITILVAVIATVISFSFDESRNRYSDWLNVILYYL